MNSATIFAKFSQGVNWNGIFYSVYKTFSTLLSFALFKYLTTQDFSTLANLNSIIFLALLWIDFGLRKSIPRYCPEFAKDAQSHQRFIRYLLIFQTSLLIITTPILMHLVGKLSKLLDLHDQVFFFYIAGGLFFMEGMQALLRLIYHAHFWNKQFNILTTIALALEMLCNICIIIYAPTSIDILKGILIAKLCVGLLVNIISVCMLSYLYKDKDYPGNQTINFGKTFIEFIKHSMMMWINTNLKSLSERNVLVPLFTYTMGAPIANLFKVANDGALFFYRIVLKTIGTTDTALLAHVQNLNEEEKLMPIAFQKLASKIAALCIPLLGILFVLFLHEQLLFSSPFVFQTFFIMTIGYIIELILSVYERVLEIKRRYLLLMFAYTPYIVMLGVMLSFNLISCIGLIGSLLIIHSVRLVSALIMLILTRTQYPLLHYPVSRIHIYLYRSILISLLLYLILTLSSYYPLVLMFIKSLIK
jgi:hypothetical protein